MTRNLKPTSGGDRIQVKIFGDRESCEANVEDEHNGNYKVTWIPRVGGEYIIHVSFSGVHLPGSPFEVHIPVGRNYTQMSMQHCFGTKGNGEGQFGSPFCVAINDDDDMYITDGANSCYYVYNKSLKFLRRFGKNGHATGDFKEPRGIAFNSKRQFGIIDAGMPTYRFQIFSPDGGAVVKEVGMMAGLKGGPKWKMRAPSGIAFTREDEIVVADTKHHRIEVFDIEGNFVREFGTQGDGICQLDRPQSVAVNSLNHIIVSDTDNHRIQVFEGDGSFLLTFGKFGSGDGQFSRPSGVCVDEDDNVIVADTENHRIQIFKPDGTFITKFGSLGSNHGQFQFPFGVAVNRNKNIIVCDTKNSRIQIW